ncbi:MAG TPA: hypothetical protein VGR24_02310 [bacterium]|jgi:plastocyanin|nr:hypothetical protein [bacterium]
MEGSQSATGISLLVSASAIALSLLVLLAPPLPVPPPAVATIDLSMLITTEGPIGGPSVSHLFDPQLLVARRGDTVRLRAINQSFFRHSIEIPEYGVSTGPLEGGERASGVLTFVADKPGIFVYRCGLPYDPATGTCSPDHDRMVGHLVVLDAPSR